MPTLNNYAENKKDIFNVLKRSLCRHAGNLIVLTDDDACYLNTHHIMKNKKPLFFGSVQIKKNYVSYHLMPVYVNPSLLDTMSAGLKKHMQGKSCFNFKAVEKNLFEELDALTEACYQFYVSEGFVIVNCKN